MEPFQPQHILCPVDFSPHSVAALRIAGHIATVFSSELIILHAQRFEPPLYFTAAQTKALKSQLRRSLRAARAYLEGFASEHLPAGLSRTYQIAEADPVEAILKAAGDSKNFLIVMGTHGRTGLTKIRMGSVAESVLRQVSQPVLTVGPKVNLASTAAPIRRIFSPVDYTQVSRKALEHAGAIAERFGAELIAGHVMEAGVPPEPARQALCDWVPAEVRKACTIREVLRQGDPAEQILLELKDSRADLLVIGAAPRSVLGSILLGSTTEKLIRSAPCPVLSVITRKK
jgi:nucleotide-binding universal stress UspA family protein